MLDGTATDVQPGRDLRIGQPFSQYGENVVLPPGQQAEASRPEASSGSSGRPKPGSCRVRISRRAQVLEHRESDPGFGDTGLCRQRLRQQHSSARYLEWHLQQAKPGLRCRQPAHGFTSLPLRQQSPATQTCSACCDQTAICRRTKRSKEFGLLGCAGQVTNSERRLTE